MPVPAVSRDELELRTRERADMADSEFVTQAEVFRYLEAAWQEFYSIVVASSEDLFTRKVTVPTSGSQTYIELPQAFKAFRLARIADSYRLRKATLQDLELIQKSTSKRKPTHYRFDLDPAATFVRMELYPNPDAVYNVEVYFVPALSLEDFTTTSYSTVLIRGWDEYLVLTAAAKCKDKEEADISNVMKEREILIERIRADLVPVDKSEPDQVVQMSALGSTDCYEEEIFS